MSPWRLALEVAAWKNGKFNARRGVALGVSVGRENVKKFFNKKWDVVVVEVDGMPVVVKPPRAFWTTCPELRSSAIGDWLEKQGLVPWQKGRPPRLVLIPQGGNRFRLAV